MLLWGAGASVALPPEPVYDEETLSKAIYEHRMGVRFLARLEREQPRWATLSLVRALGEQRDEALELFARRLEQIDEATAIGSEEEPVVVLKGVTAYALTLDPAAIRRSNDLDLIWHDPQALTDALLELGYSDSDDPRRGHEFASLYKDGLNVDVHGYMPVPHVARGDLDALRPEANPGTWTGLAAMREAQVDYETLNRRRVRRELGRGISADVADPVLAALILCTHSFREYSHRPFLRTYATIRLNELCDLAALATHPDFSTRAFLALADEFEMQTSVEFSSYLLGALLGRPDALGVPIDHAPVFPYDLWLEGFTIADGRAEDAEALLIRPAAVTMGLLVERLGGNGVAAGARYATQGDDGKRRIERVLVHGEGLAADVAFDWTPERLVIDVEAETGPSGMSVLVNTGDIRFELAFDPGSGVASSSWQRNTSRGRGWSTPLTLHGATKGRRNRLSIGLRWREALESSPAREALPMLLGVRTEERGVLMPLVVAPQ